MLIGPYGLTGTTFVLLYGLMLCVACGFSLIFPILFRPAGRPQGVTDLDQLAMLSGGQARLAEVAITGLLVSRAVLVSKHGLSVLDRHFVSKTPIEAAIMRLPAKSNWLQILEATKAHVAPIEQRLILLDLVTDERDFKRTRLLQIFPFLMLIGFVGASFFVGRMSSETSTVVAILLGITFIVACFRCNHVDRRTEASISVIKMAKQHALRLRQAPTKQEMALAVALFGTIVLSNSSFDEFHRFRTFAPTSDGGGGGCGSSGCGGGGGCGGGD